MVKREKEAGDVQDLNIRGGCLCLHMGMGKTVTTLAHIANTLCPGFPTLIVCPKSAIKTWKDEIKMFFGDQLSLYVFHPEFNNLKTVTRAHLCSHDLVLTSYNLVTLYAYDLNLPQKICYADDFTHRKGTEIITEPLPITETLDNSQLGKSLLFTIPFARIVADESHNFANYDTKLWKAMMCLYGTYKWCLSGTPIRNYANKDLYAQFKFLGYYDLVLDPVEFISKLPNIRDYIRNVDYVEAEVVLPPLEHRKVSVMLNNEQRKVYDYFADQTRAFFEEFTLGTKQFSDVLTMFMRLRQVCVAPYTICPDDDRRKKMNDEEEKKYLNSQRALQRTHPDLVKAIHNRQGPCGIHSAKIDTVMDILKEIPEGDKVLIFSSFVKVLDLVKEAMRQEHPQRKSVMLEGSVPQKERESRIDKFKTDKDVSVMFLNYKVGSESLNLTVANHVILIESWWSFATIQQAVARCHRMGQTKPVTVYELFAFLPDKSTIESRILEVCEKKQQMAQKYLKGEMVPSGAKEQKLDRDLLGHLLW